jgi:hypothetical protein
MAHGRCKLCGAWCDQNRLSPRGVITLSCDDCMQETLRNLPDIVSNRPFDHACDALTWHFACVARDQLATSRQFPGHMRADGQIAIDRLFSETPIRFFGIHEQHRYETLTMATLTQNGRGAHAIAPAQYHDVDVGDDAPVKCLNNGLWLCQSDGLRYAVVLSSHREYGYEAGTRIEIAVPAGAPGAELVQRCFFELERAVNAARSYRGKILSLDGDADYRGRSRGVMVHKLPAVGQYMNLAGLLQPTMVVIEDVDLIRARPRRHGALRGIPAQRPAQPDGRAEAGCGHPVHPHHQPA